MANNYESTVDEMLNELNGLKESSLNTGVSLSKTQVNVLSTSFDKIVIQINLNETNDSNNSKKESVSDEEDGNDSNNKEERNDSVSHSYNESQSSSSVKESKISEEKPLSTSQQNLNQMNSSRSFRRTISESSSNEWITRGILKYPHNWNRRTVSESSCDLTNSDFDHYSDSYYTSIEEIYENDDDLYSDDKPKKNVRFNEHVSKTVFRGSSSILGRKSKNQKRSKKRKNSKQNSDFTRNQTNSSEQSLKLDKNKNNHPESQRLPQDSGYDSEDVGHENVKHDNYTHNESHKQNQFKTSINSQSNE